MNTKRLLSIAVMSATVLGAAAASAGVRMTANVVIDDTLREASGSIGSARNSTDTRQHIGCHTETAAGATTSFASCSALAVRPDGTFVTRTCTTTDPKLVERAATVGSDSWVRFRWNGEGKCTYLSVNNDSRYEPKK